VFFPVMLWLLSRRPRLCSIFAGMVFASFAVGVYGTWTHPIGAYFLLPTRAWELLAGATLAAYCVPANIERSVRTLKSARTTKISGWLGLALIIAGFFLIDEGDNFPGIVALVPTIATLAVLVSIADGSTGTGWLLSRPPMVWIGKLSYSIYLWHW